MADIFKYNLLNENISMVIPTYGKYVTKTTVDQNIIGYGLGAEIIMNSNADIIWHN